MISYIQRIEYAARIALGNDEPNDPLPPGPNYGPFGYFRLGVLIFFLVVVAIALYAFL
jgi:hypothetical protein